MFPKTSFRVVMFLFTLVATLSAANWTMNGSSVYWSNPNYYISATPAYSYSSTGDYEQVMDFISTNATPEYINLSFVFHSPLITGSVKYWNNVSHAISTYGRINKSVTLNVSSYAAVSINNSAQCVIGDLNNSLFYNITYVTTALNGSQTTATNVACFNSVTNNGSMYTLLYQEYGVNGTQYIYYYDWDDITQIFQFSDLNVTSAITVPVYGRVNKSVIGLNVSSYTAVNVTYSTQCYIGDINNSLFFNLTYIAPNGSTTSNIACFNSFTNVGSIYDLYYQENGQVGNTSQNVITNYQVFTVNDVFFNASMHYKLKFNYKINNGAQSGKFDVFAHTSSPQAVVNGTGVVLLELDPWWIFTPPAVSPFASGGTVTRDGNYYVHTFKGNETFSLLNSANGALNVTVLVVAGGGSGGYNLGGGGGAGGLLYNTSYNVTGNINVVIGAGGAASTGAVGNNGSNSSFGTLVAVGGGTGGNAGPGHRGGSGGGGGHNNVGDPPQGVGGPGIAGQGYDGGKGGYDTPIPFFTGGGGGAGGLGGNWSTGFAGNGGAGLTYSINGSSVCYAGGGGGGFYSSGSAGTATCGGGAGGANAGTVNTGGGGGGQNNNGGNGGAGGSGVVIVRYAALPPNEPTNTSYSYVYQFSRNDLGGEATNPMVNITMNSSRAFFSSFINTTTGANVRFYANNNLSNQRPYYIENNSNEFIYWVRTGDTINGTVYITMAIDSNMAANHENRTGAMAGYGAIYDFGGNFADQRGIFNFTTTAGAFQSGKFGQALNVTAAQPLEVSSVNVLNYTQTLTQSVWVYVTGTSNFDMLLVTCDSSYTGNVINKFIYYPDGTKLGGFRSANGVADYFASSGEDIVTGAWTKYTYTYDQTNLSIYKNGVLKGSGAGNGNGTGGACINKICLNNQCGFGWGGNDGLDGLYDQTVIKSGTLDSPQTILFEYWQNSSVIAEGSSGAGGATGCTITTDGNYTVHTCLSNATVNITGTVNATVLVVAGGGGGSSVTGSAGGGGGGAGGLIYNTSVLLSTNSYPVVIGAGGLAVIDASSNSGENSTFAGLVAVGGGGAGNYYGGTGYDGKPGGSGGGAWYLQSGGAGTAGQGNAGGDDGSVRSGGGGGAGAAGGTGATSAPGGAGGVGLNYTINGSNVYYAGGGGGATASADGFQTAGGNGGGGKGGWETSAAATSGTNGTGGGGGSGWANNPSGNGGSGIVIIRYLTTTTSNNTSSNNLPNITAISVVPAAPFSNQTISCNVTATDAESAATNITGWWFRNGANQTALAFTFNNLPNNTATLVSNLTSGNISAGQNWSCSAIAYDGANYSSITNSVNITIKYVPPTILYNLSFVAGSTSHSFTASAGVTGDGASAIKSTNISTTAGSCAALSNATVGSNFNVTYNCTGTAPASPTIIIGFTDQDNNYVQTPSAANAYPDHVASLTAPTVSSPLYINSTATCTNGTYSDLDQDTENSSARTWAWYKNGVIQAGTGSTLVLSSISAVKGNNIACRETTTNSTWTTSNATAISANVTVSNSLPTIAVQPFFANFSVGHKFNVTAGVIDIDGVSDVSATNISTTAGSCVYASNTTSGNYLNATFNCTATTPGTATITIGFTDASGAYVATNGTGSNAYPDHAPTINQPTVNTPPFYAASTATCTPATIFTDVDGDTENAASRTWAWYKNGTVIAGQTASTLVLSVAGIVHFQNVSCNETVSANTWTTLTATNMSANVSLLNTVPVTAAPTLAPNPVATIQTLTCNNGSTSDADLDTVTFFYDWFVNGTLVKSGNNTLEGTLYFNKTDNVTCQITPFDSYANGTAKNASIVVSDTNPVIITQPFFADFSVGHKFNVTAEAYDEDGAYDIVATNISTTAGSCVYASNTTSGNYLNATFNCTATTPGAATITIGFTDASGAYVATNGTSSKAYPDHAPTINQPIVNTPPFYAASTATCTPATTFTDVDSDTENASSREWTWYKNGTLIVGQIANTLVLTVADIVHFDNVSCQEVVRANVWVYNTATNMSANVSVSNTVPVTSTPTLTPLPAYTNTTLTCTNGTTSDADHDAVTFLYAWFVNGNLLIGETANTLSGIYPTPPPPHNFVKDDNVTCQITPFDGIANGIARNASTIIQNLPPVLEYVEILNSTNGYIFRTGENLYGWMRAYDTDGDDIYYNQTYTRMQDGYQIVLPSTAPYFQNFSFNPGFLSYSSVANREVWNLTVFAVDPNGSTSNSMTSYAIIISNVSNASNGTLQGSASAIPGINLNLPGAGDIYLNKTIAYDFTTQFTQTYTVNTYRDGTLIDQRDYILSQRSLAVDDLHTTSFSNTTIYGNHTYYVDARAITNFTALSTSASRDFEVAFYVSQIQPVNGSTFNGTSITYSYNTTNLYPITCAVIANGVTDDSRVVAASATETMTVPKASGVYNWYVACYGNDNLTAWRNTTNRTYAFGAFNGSTALPNYTNVSLGPENVYPTPQALFYDLNNDLNVMYYTDVGGIEYLQIRTINGSAITQLYNVSQTRGGDFAASFRLANNTTLLTFDNSTARFVTFANGSRQQGTIAGLYAIESNAFYDPYTYAYTKQFYNLTITPDSYYLFVIPSGSGASLTRMNATLNGSGVSALTTVEALGYPTAWQTIARDSSLLSWYYAKPQIGGTFVLNFTSAAVSGDLPTYTPGTPNDIISGGGSCFGPWGPAQLPGPQSCSYTVNSNASLAFNGTGTIAMTLDTSTACPNSAGTNTGTLSITNGSSTISLASYALGCAGSTTKALNVTRSGSTTSVTDGITTVNFLNNASVVFNWTASGNSGSQYGPVWAGFTGTATFPSTLGNTNSTITIYSYNNSTSTSFATPDATAYSPTAISNSTIVFESYENHTYYMQFGGQIKPVVYQLETGKNYTFNSTATNPSNFYFVDTETFIFFSVESGSTWAYSCYFGNAIATCERIASTAYGATVPYNRGTMTTSKRVPNVMTGPQDVVTTGFITSGSNVTVLHYNTYTYDLKMSCYDEPTQARKLMNVRSFSPTASVVMDPNTYLYGYVMQNSLLGAGIKKVYSYCIDPDVNGTLGNGTNRMYVYDTNYYNLNTFSLEDVSPNAYYTFYVVNCFNQPSSNALVTAERFMNDRQAYAIVEQAYTSFAGDAVLFLQPFIPYRITITATDGVTQTFDFTPATSATTTIPVGCSGLNINTTPTGDQVYDDVSYSIKATAYPSGAIVTGGQTNESVNISFNYSSPSNRVYSANYVIYRTDAGGMRAMIYNETDYASAGYRMLFINASTGVATYDLQLNMDVLRLYVNNTNNSVNMSSSDQMVMLYAKSSVSIVRYDASSIDIRANLQNSFCGAGYSMSTPCGGGWAYIFIATILTMLVVGYVSRFTLDGAGLIGAVFFIGLALLNPISILVAGVVLPMYAIGGVALIVALVLVVWRYV